MKPFNERLKGLVSHDQLKDKLLGSAGTPGRDAYELEFKAEMIGHAIREMRRKRALTQDQLGELVGVGKSQISKIENGGSNLTIATMVRVMAALDGSISLSLRLDGKEMAAI